MLSSLFPPLYASVQPQAAESKIKQDVKEMNVKGTTDLNITYYVHYDA